MDCQLRFFYAIFVVCAVALVNGAPPQKIVNGEVAKRDEFPYIVSIHKNGRHFCGGAIISEKHILTAAHCVDEFMDLNNLTNVRVFSGLTDLYAGQGESHRVVKAVKHPGYFRGMSNFPNDIALLTLSSSMEFNSHQTKINLPITSFVDGSLAVVAGWGKTSNSSINSRILKKVEVVAHHCSVPGLVERRVCGVRKSGLGVCSGDFGSPLVVRNVVIGITSFDPIPCGASRSDYYTNVLDNNLFIKNHMYDGGH